MNGFIKATVAGLCLGTGLSSLVGCYEYRQIVDPCWPERYNAESRMSVRETFGAQAHNGHVLDQTMWNYHFEVDPRTGAPTDKLNPAGMEHLRYISRVQPSPDPALYLQTVEEIPGAATMSSEKLAQFRSELDSRRVAAIQKYMTDIQNGHNHSVPYQVAIIDHAEPGMPALPISGNQSKFIIKGALPDNWNNFKGKMPGVEGVTLTTGGGS